MIHMNQKRQTDIDIVMPYINYRTKDYINGVADTYKDTDIIKSAANIQGRIQEFVVTKENIPIPAITNGNNT